MLYLHQVFCYFSTLFPSCPRKKISENPTEIFSSALVCLKEFWYVEFSQNTSKLFSPANGPENCWALAAVHHSTCAGKFKHVFKCFAGSRELSELSYQHFVVQRITKYPVQQSNIENSVLGHPLKSSTRNWILIRWSYNTLRCRGLICGY